MGMAPGDTEAPPACPWDAGDAPRTPKIGDAEALRPCCRARTGCEGHSSPPGAVPHALGSLTTRATSNYRREMHPRGGRSVRTLPWHGAWLHRAIRGTKLGFFFWEPRSRRERWFQPIGAGGAASGLEEHSRAQRGGRLTACWQGSPPGFGKIPETPLCAQLQPPGPNELQPGLGDSGELAGIKAPGRWGGSR